MLHYYSCDCKEALTLVKLKELGYLSIEQKQEREREERELKRKRNEGLWRFFNLVQLSIYFDILKIVSANNFVIYLFSICTGWLTPMP